MSQNIHQKLGCQANGGARAGRAPPRSANAQAQKYNAGFVNYCNGIAAPVNFFSGFDQEIEGDTALM